MLVGTCLFNNDNTEELYFCIDHRPKGREGWTRIDVHDSDCMDFYPQCLMCNKGLDVIGPDDEEDDDD